MSHIPPGMLLRVVNNKEDLIKSYVLLISFAPNDETRTMLNGILDEEKNHLTMFSSLYSAMFGDAPPLTGGTAQQISSYNEGLDSMILAEFIAHSFYGNIVFTDDDQNVRDVFMRAVFDENIHSTKLNYLIGKRRGGIVPL